MIRKVLLPSPKKPKRDGARHPKKKIIQRLVENKLIGRVSYEEYRDRVPRRLQRTAGALLATASLLSLHTPLGDRLFREAQIRPAQAPAHSRHRQRGRATRQADAQIRRPGNEHHLLRSLAEDVAPRPGAAEKQRAASRSGRSGEPAVRRRQLRLRDVRLRVGTLARRQTRAARSRGCWFRAADCCCSRPKTASPVRSPAGCGVAARTIGASSIASARNSD